MRKNWTNLILHTLALIDVRKKNLLVAHAWRSVFDVLVIVLLEFVLMIVSLPLYLVSKESKIGNVKQYSIRRTLSLSMVVVILLVGILKMVLLVGLPFFFDTRQEYIVTQTVENAPAEDSVYTLIDVYRARTDATVSVPVIQQVIKKSDVNFLVSGTADATTQAVLTVGRVDGGRMNSESAMKMYVEDVTADGHWSTMINADSLRLRAGDYWLRAFGYQQTKGLKSEVGQAQYFSIAPTVRDLITSRVDTYLNYFIAIFLLVSMLAIVFLI